MFLADGGFLEARFRHPMKRRFLASLPSGAGGNPPKKPFEAFKAGIEIYFLSVLRREEAMLVLKKQKLRSAFFHIFQGVFTMS